MRYRIEIYDSGTEEHEEDIGIPINRKKDLFDLMRWQDPENEIYIYDLSARQVKILEEWVGRGISSPNRIALLAVLAD